MSPHPSSTCTGPCRGPGCAAFPAARPPCSLRRSGRALACVGGGRGGGGSPSPPETGEAGAHLHGCTRVFVECVSHGLKTYFPQPRTQTRVDAQAQGHTRCWVCNETSLALGCTRTLGKPLVQN